MTNVNRKAISGKIWLSDIRELYNLLVDDILFQSEAIIKTLGDFLGKQRFVYGLVIGEKGDLYTVLDIHDIIGSDEFSKKINGKTPRPGINGRGI